MNKEILIEDKSIVLLIGPSNSGKTFFCENYLIPFLRSNNVNSHYLSSDNFRRELLGTNYHKHDSRMNVATKFAFELLNKKLSLLTSYPINSNVIIVDATNLSTYSREKFLETAKINNYKLTAIVFDYETKEEYLKYIDKDTNTKVIADMVEKFKKTTLKELDAKSFSSIFKLKTQDFSELTFLYEQENLGLDVSTLTDYAVIGDVHGCLDELKEVIYDLGYSIENGLITNKSKKENKKIILVGDLIDKGPKIKETIEFIYNNLSHFYLVIGNHEYWVNLYMTGKLKSSSENSKLINSWFDTVLLLEKDEVLKNKFFAIYSEMYPYIKTSNAIITHAPCENKYLGKSDSKSLKAQRNFSYNKKEELDSEEVFLEKRFKEFEFLINDSDLNFPYHIFGHVMLPSVFKYKNKIGLDTGCVAGNFLSSVHFSSNSDKPFIKKYKSLQLKKEELFTLIKEKPREISLENLDIEDKVRLKWAAENKLNFISGTMSPSNKVMTEEQIDLESLTQGIDYFRNKGVKKVILQPKYMGSRCNALIHKSEITKCKMFSRNGYLIQNSWLKTEKKLEQLFQEIQTTYAHLFVNDLEYILFDGELLPWSSIGENLIEEEFRYPIEAFNNEYNYLKGNNFEKELDNLVLNGKDKNLIGSFLDSYLPLDISKTHVEKLHTQVDIFGYKGELEYKPFFILKHIYTDKREEVFIDKEISNIEVFKTISSSPYCILDFEEELCYIKNSNEIENSFPLYYGADIFYKYLTENLQLEGVVIKPESAFVKDCAPYLKVRNKEYLRMTYGFDYKALSGKYDELLKNKSITRKIKTSIKEWELGKELLKIPMDSISLQNSEWLSLVYSLMNEQKSEKELDPRL